MQNNVTSWIHMATVSMKLVAYPSHTLNPVVALSGREIPHLTLQALGEAADVDLLNAENVSNKTFADDLHFLISAVIGPIVSLFGMAGNLLSIIIWRRPGMGSSTGRYLTGQAMANVFLLLMFLLCDSLQYWCPEFKNSNNYGTFFCYLGYPLYYISITCSIWFTVGLTLDRYIMVCWITKAKSLCSEARADFSLILITFISFIINIPHFASYTPIFLEDDGNNNHSNGNHSNNNTKIKEADVAIRERDFISGEGGKLYELWIHCFMLTFIPWVSILFMNIIIIIKINEANTRMADKKTSQSLKKSKDSENQITRLLLSVTFTFLFFIGLQCVTTCLWLKKAPEADPVKVSASFSFGKVGSVFNSSSNFVLYCLAGRRFRIELLKMLGLVKKDQLLSSMVDTLSSNISTTTMTTSATGTETKRA